MNIYNLLYLQIALDSPRVDSQLTKLLELRMVWGHFQYRKVIVKGLGLTWDIGGGGKGSNIGLTTRLLNNLITWFSNLITKYLQNLIDTMQVSSQQ